MNQFYWKNTVNYNINTGSFWTILSMYNVCSNIKHWIFNSINTRSLLLILVFLLPSIWEKVLVLCMNNNANSWKHWWYVTFTINLCILHIHSMDWYHIIIGKYLLHHKLLNNQQHQPAIKFVAKMYHKILYGKKGK